MNYSLNVFTTDFPHTSHVVPIHEIGGLAIDGLMAVLP
jgi:hypothetical protein